MPVLFFHPHRHFLHFSFQLAKMWWKMWSPLWLWTLLMSAEYIILKLEGVSATFGLATQIPPNIPQEGVSEGHQLLSKKHLTSLPGRVIQHSSLPQQIIKHSRLVIGNYLQDTHPQTYTVHISRTSYLFISNLYYPIYILLNWFISFGLLHSCNDNKDSISFYSIQDV